MKLSSSPRNVKDTHSEFDVLQNDERMQTAVMRLDPGEESGPFGNEHKESVQVLLVVEGEVIGRIGDHTWTLRAGDSVIVQRGEPHQFRNESQAPALTFNVYSPPAY